MGMGMEKPFSQTSNAVGLLYRSVKHDQLHSARPVEYDSIAVFFRYNVT